MAVSVFVSAEGSVDTSGSLLVDWAWSCVSIAEASDVASCDVPGFDDLADSDSEASCDFGDTMSASCDCGVLSDPGIVHLLWAVESTCSGPVDGSIPVNEGCVGNCIETLKYSCHEMASEDE